MDMGKSFSDEEMKKPPFGDFSTLALNGLSTSELSDYIKYIPWV